MSRKKKIIVAALVLLFVVAAVAVFMLSRFQATSTERLDDRYGMFAASLETGDHDGDGIADSADILQGALDYIQTKPKYGSSYYEGGYPNDGYGVCTDLVAASTLAAGYDLQALVDADIRENPAVYDVEEADSNIDYRRAKNLHVYFERNARCLTTALSAIDEWQGGDIAVFADHVGIVSDRRNERGVPYIIHHDGPFQDRYEQDVLESRHDLVGHYRLG